MQILGHMKCVLGRTHLVSILFSPQLSISFHWDQPFSNIRMDLTHCLFHWGKSFHHRLLEVALVVMSGRAQQKSHIEANLCRWDEIRKDNHSLGLPHLKITEMSSWNCSLALNYFLFPAEKKGLLAIKMYAFCFVLISSNDIEFINTWSSYKFVANTCESTSFRRRVVNLRSRV